MEDRVTNRKAWIALLSLSKAAPVRKGKEHLLCVQLSKLEEAYRREHQDRSRDRLQDAVLRKMGLALKDTTRILRRGISTTN